MNWDDVRVMLAVAEAGTLSAAARRLGVNQTTVARRLAAVERALETVLFTRIDGRLVPTAAGEAAVTRAEAMAREAEALRAAVGGGDARPAGIVRLTATESVAAHFLLPRLPAFRARWPGITLEIVTGHETLNLTRREADMALRLARPADVGAVARRLGGIAMALYGAVGDARALPRREWVGYDDTLAHLPEARWAEAARADAPVVLRTGSIAALVEAVARGVGIGVLPCWIADADDRLVRLATEPAAVREVWLVTHAALRDQARMRAVAGWLGDIFAAPARCSYPPTVRPARTPPAGNRSGPATAALRPRPGSACRAPGRGGGSGG